MGKTEVMCTAAQLQVLVRIPMCQYSFPLQSWDHVDIAAFFNDAIEMK